jgi:CubicO group peptidase (beta-lactamase class C family)
VCSDLAAADAIVSNYFDRGGQPAIAYGIVRDGKLVHSAGFGSRFTGGPAPDADTVFRIASMSKSFTASAVLLLRDSGQLALDDPAEKYVPEMAGWPPVTADADQVTIRHLLTMTAGFPTDDPWGDRQQGLPPSDFGSLLAGGVGFNWAPGTRFEYSNMGYAILGRVVAAVSGVAYDEFVRTRLFTPLGMARTGFSAEEFSVSGVAVGYRRGMVGWEEVPFDANGAFAPMGGVFSCVSDLARWVAGFAAAFPPGGPDGDGGLDGTGAHPLRRASRREMQLPQAVTGWSRPERLPGGGPGSPAYYGFGLFADEDPTLGRVVGHSGGYPGFGSNMRWHLATGTGVIALGNGTYAAMSMLSGLVLGALVPRSLSYHVALAPASASASGPASAWPAPASAAPASAAPAPASAAPAPASAPATRAGAPWPETLAARDAVNRLLARWDNAAADALFCANVALDSPYAERRHAIGLIAERIGDFAPDGTRQPESDTPAHCRWWLAGERGVVQAQIQLNPERPPRVQSLTLAVPPGPGSPLTVVLESVVDWMNSGSEQWPASVPVAVGTDAGLLSRRLRMAAVWAGRCAPGAYRAGDGGASVSVDLAGEHATVVLTLAVNPATGELRQAEITL